MTAEHQKRSTMDELSTNGPRRPGVGGRQRPLHPPPRGGGYLNNCNASEVRDPRLDDLAAAHMPAALLRIAERIGVDAFLEVWRELDKSEDLPRTDNGMILLRFRPYKSWLTYQRNRYILALHDAGRRPSQIKQALLDSYNIVLTPRHITRIIKSQADV